MKWFLRLALGGALPLLSACTKEIADINAITTPVGGSVAFTVTGKYIHGPTDYTTSEVEALSFSSSKLGAYRSAKTEVYTVFLEKDAGGQATAQVMLSFAGGAGTAEVGQGQVVLLPGKSGSQVAYTKLAGYTSSVTKLVIGEVGKKVSGTFQFNAPKANAVDRTDVYTIKGTFECNRLPDSD